MIDGTVVITYLVDTNRDYAQVLEERDENGNLLVRHVYGHDLISQTINSATTCYHYDGSGSTRALTNGSEGITDTYTYDAFGNLLDKTGSTTNTHLYTGEFFDSNTGFYYLRARYMNPAIGRFVTMDTFAGRNRDPYSLHKYLYAHANPVNLVDPSGQMSTYNEVVISGAIIGALCGVYAYNVITPSEDRTFTGAMTWAAGGALVGGLLAHGTWVLWLGPTLGLASEVGYRIFTNQEVRNLLPQINSKKLQHAFDALRHWHTYRPSSQRHLLAAIARVLRSTVDNVHIARGIRLGTETATVYTRQVSIGGVLRWLSVAIYETGPNAGTFATALEPTAQQLQRYGLIP